MNRITKMLTEYVNKEMINYDITIKEFSLRCGISYNEMRNIANGRADDLLLSTIIRICDNSHFDISNLIIQDISREEQLINNIYHQLKIKDFKTKLKELLKEEEKELEIYYKKENEKIIKQKWEKEKYYHIQKYLGFIPYYA